MDELMTWIWLALPAALAVVAMVWLRATSARKRVAAALAARQRAEQQARQAEHARAMALAAAELRAAEEATRQQAQARLQAQREASAAEREARRRAADEAARAHAEGRAGEAAARAEQAARRAAALRRATPPPPPPPSPRPQPTPARAVAPATPAPTAATAPRTPEQTLVMVVDDSKVVRVKVSRLLAQQGYRVVLAENGLAALQQMQAEMPQVVITDAEMPGMDGIELTRHMRGQPGSAKLPILMISSADTSLGPKAAAAGVTALLGKPYGDDELLEHVRRARLGVVTEITSGERV